jgi:ankyrin repeat protein
VIVGEVAVFKFRSSTPKKDIDLFPDLYDAVSTGDINRVKEQLEVSGPLGKVEPFHGMTPLDLAILSDRLEMVHFLIGKGASLNLHTDVGRTLISYVQSVDMARFLLDIGADVNVKHGTDGSTPLVLQNRKLNIPLVKVLLEAGADATFEQNPGTKWARKAMCHAVNAESTELAHLLLDYGASPDVLSSSTGEPSLVWAIFREDFALAHKMIDRGVKINCKNWVGETPFLAATKLGNLGLVRKLAENGLDRDYCEQMKNAVWWAQFKRHREISEYLRTL